MCYVSEYGLKKVCCNIPCKLQRRNLKMKKNDSYQIPIPHLGTKIHKLVTKMPHQTENYIFDTSTHSCILSKQALMW